MNCVSLTQSVLLAIEQRSSCLNSAFGMRWKETFSYHRGTFAGISKRCGATAWIQAHLTLLIMQFH